MSHTHILSYSKIPEKSAPSDKKFKSDEFIESSDEEKEGKKDAFIESSIVTSCHPLTEEEETTGSRNWRSRRNDDSGLVELSEGSHDESEAEMSGSDNDEYDN